MYVFNVSTSKIKLFGRFQLYYIYFFFFLTISAKVLYVSYNVIFGKKTVVKVLNWLHPSPFLWLFIHLTVPLRYFILILPYGIDAYGVCRDNHPKNSLYTRNVLTSQLPARLALHFSPLPRSTRRLPQKYCTRPRLIDPKSPNANIIRRNSP